MQGGLDSPLTALGVAQAHAMGAILRREGALGLPAFTSPQGRAARTADLALGEGRARRDPRLREVGVGRFEGRLLSELTAEHPYLFDEGAPMDWYFDAPGGEGFEGLHARASAFLGDLTGPAVVVCHGITARVLRGLVLGLDRDAMAGLPGGQGVVWRLSGGRHEVLTAP